MELVRHRVVINWTQKLANEFGTANEFGNYRPVSLLPALSKILEKAVCQQLMAYFHKYNLLCNHQYGFRAKNQTTHVMHSMLNSISQNMTQGICTIASFIDLSKAFDCLQYDKFVHEDALHRIYRQYRQMVPRLLIK